jgi:phage gp29-like protein
MSTIQILGPDGQPLRVDTGRLAEPQTASVGYLQSQLAEHPARGLTPERLAAILLRAEQGDLLDLQDLAEDIEERDAHAYAELGKRRGALTVQSWTVEPPKNADAAERRLADEVSAWLDGLRVTCNGEHGGLALAITEMTSAILRGYAPLEMVWTPEADASGRRVLMPTLTSRPQRWMRASACGTRLLLRSQTDMVAATEHLPAVAGQELLPLAWLVHQHPARTGYVTRQALARVLAWPYLIKHYGLRDWSEFLEIYGLPLRVGRYPSGATPAERMTLLRAVTQIGHDAAGIIPQGMSIEFIKAAEGQGSSFGEIASYMDRAESKAILGQTLTADAGSVGSQALGTVHNDVRMDIRDDDATRLQGTLDRLVRHLVAVNRPGVAPGRCPRVTLDNGEAEDLAAYAEALPKLVAVGVRVPVSWAHDKLRIPEPTDGEAVLATAPAPAPAPTHPTTGAPAHDPAAPSAQPPGAPTGAPPGARAAGAGQPADPAAAGGPQALVGLQQLLRAIAQPAHALRAGAGAPAAAPAADALDPLVAEAAVAWRPVLGPIVSPLLTAVDSAVASGETLESLTARLPALIAQMQAGPLADAVARAQLAARLAGEAGLQI